MLMCGVTTWPKSQQNRMVTITRFLNNVSANRFFFFFLCSRHNDFFIGLYTFDSSFSTAARRDYAPNQPILCVTKRPPNEVETFFECCFFIDRTHAHVVPVWLQRQLGPRLRRKRRTTTTDARVHIVTGPNGEIA